MKDLRFKCGAFCGLYLRHADCTNTASVLEKALGWHITACSLTVRLNAQRLCRRSCRTFAAFLAEWHSRFALYCAMWRRVIWYKYIDVSEEPTAKTNRHMCTNATLRFIWLSLTINLFLIVIRDKLSRYSDSPQVGRSGDRIPVGRDFSHPFRRLGNHPTSYTMGTGFFPGVKRPERGVGNPSPSSTEVKERLKLYL